MYEQNSKPIGNAISQFWKDNAISASISYKCVLIIGHQAALKSKINNPLELTKFFYTKNESKKKVIIIITSDYNDILEMKISKAYIPLKFTSDSNLCGCVIPYMLPCLSVSADAIVPSALSADTYKHINESLMNIFTDADTIIVMNYFTIHTSDSLVKSKSLNMNLELVPYLKDLFAVYGSKVLLYSFAYSYVSVFSLNYDIITAQRSSA